MSQQKYIIQLNKRDRTKLQRIIDDKKTDNRKRIHAQTVLQSDTGKYGPALSDKQIGKVVDISHGTVSVIRQRFAEQGLMAAIERKKTSIPTRRRAFNAEQELKLVALCKRKAPGGRRRWSLRMLSDEVTRLKISDVPVSYETIRKTLIEHNVTL